MKNKDSAFQLSNTLRMYFIFPIVVVGTFASLLVYNFRSDYQNLTIFSVVSVTIFSYLLFFVSRKPNWILLKISGLLVGLISIWLFVVCFGGVYMGASVGDQWIVILIISLSGLLFSYKLITAGFRVKKASTNWQA